MSDRARLEQELVSFIGGLTHDPLGFARAMYPWREPGPLEQLAGPRVWQATILDCIGRHLRAPETRHMPLKLAVASGHGIGKSALVAMIVDWAMSTCEDCRVLVTANTLVQLRTKTWPEVAKWVRRALNRHWFEVTSTSMTTVDRPRELTWRADAVTWSANNTEAFAGLHNVGKRIVIVFDESSSIVDKVWEVAEGALTDEHTEIIFLAFGNPTLTTGRFRECFPGGRHHRSWRTWTIDSRTVEGTNKAFLDQLVATWGLDSDIVKVRVLGQFPARSVRQFIGSDVAEAAAKREPQPLLSDPLVAGVDVARFGDDMSVIRFRRGRDARTIPPIKLRGATTIEIAGRIADAHRQHGLSAVFVDGSGGFGGGVVDQVRALLGSAVTVYEVQFGAKSDRVSIDGIGRNYANKRAEMWGNLGEWLAGGAIDADAELIAGMTAVEYSFVVREGKDAVLLEPKDVMKARGLASPDDADALALTFAYPVPPKTTASASRRQANVVSDYDPFS